MVEIHKGGMGVGAQFGKNSQIIPFIFLNRSFSVFVFVKSIVPVLQYLNSFTSLIYMYTGEEMLQS